MMESEEIEKQKTFQKWKIIFWEHCDNWGIMFLFEFKWECYLYTISGKTCPIYIQ